MGKIAHIIFVSALILSIAWFIAQPGYEPVITFLFGFAGLIGAQFVKRTGDVTKKIPLASHSFSEAEKEILVYAADSGEIRILKVNAFGDWVRCGQDKNFFSQTDLAFNAKYLEAFERLCQKGLVRHQSGILYRLTGTGFDVARRLKNQSNPQ